VLQFCFYSCSLATRKLFALVNGKCSPETTDSPMNQEILLAGHLYLMALKVYYLYSKVKLVCGLLFCLLEFQVLYTPYICLTP